MRIKHIRRTRREIDYGTLRVGIERVSMVGYTPPIAHPPLVDFTWLLEPVATRRFIGSLLCSFPLTYQIFRKFDLFGF